MPTPTPRELKALTLVLTTACNHNCDYCFQKATRDEKISWETVKISLDVLLRSQQKALKIEFYGGEPLLEFDLIRRAVEYVNAKKTGDQRVAWAVTTNGSLLRDEVIDFLAAHWFRMTISFDGVEAAQHARRGSNGEQIEGVLKGMRTFNPVYFREKARIGMTVTSANVQYLAASINRLHSLDVSQIDIGPMITHDNGWTDATSTEFDCQVEKIFHASIQNLREKGAVPIAFFRTNDAKPQAQDRPLMCDVTRGDNLTVDVDGLVYGCVMFVESYRGQSSEFLVSRLTPMRLGNIGDFDLQNRLARYPSAVGAAEMFGNPRLNHSPIGACAECPYIHFCQVCPVSIAHIPGNTDPHRVPLNQCAFNMTVGKWRARFPGEVNPLAAVLKHSRRPKLMEKIEAAQKDTHPKPALAKPLRYL